VSDDQIHEFFIKSTAHSKRWLNLRGFQRTDRRWDRAHALIRHGRCIGRAAELWQVHEACCVGDATMGSLALKGIRPVRGDRIILSRWNQCSKQAPLQCILSIMQYYSREKLGCVKLAQVVKLRHGWIGRWPPACSCSGLWLRWSRRRLRVPP
jgi:hypothetical protein